MTINDTNWQVPSFTEALYATRRHLYALVIPVINEGERIRNQLARIAEADPPVDVVIADGGSTDGSLDPELLHTQRVHSVLTKTGSGKLSAQLRMAYAWCLRRRYKGIVTMDGNGKDGIEAIAEFVEKLKDGYDYVQGSRYCPGGRAINTPFERAVGNRLIHAPLLSLAGRNRYTDTTNGFRAYSARFLLDPEVAPFRNVFTRYELLFYLTVRAGQLRYRVCEIPVQRRYPGDEAVPTKITGLNSKLSLFGQSLHAALGTYHPVPE